MSVSPEMQARIAILREKARNETLTLDEMKEGINFLRQERMAMAPAKVSAKKAAASIDANSLLGELGI